VTVFRSWAAADLSAGGRTFRVITTHLDLDSVEVQRAQAQEMLCGPADTPLPVLLLGDFNCIPESNAPTYRALVDAGFADAWRLLRPSDGGHTCCQWPDLLNRETALDSRVDLVLVRGPWKVGEVATVGEEPADRSRGGLWPSDHAGVVATLSAGSSAG
jgi:endonuclease/exonuclease/phosphatase family metal-dependent hydrolase